MSPGSSAIRGWSDVVVEVLSFLEGYDRLGRLRGAAERCTSKSLPWRLEIDRLERSSPMLASQTKSELLEREDAVTLWPSSPSSSDEKRGSPGSVCMCIFGGAAS